MDTPIVVEVALFRLKAGITDEEFLPSSELIQQHLDQSQGYISRELVKAPDGQWVDIVHWTSLEAANEAGAQIMADEEVAPFFAMIDEDESQMIFANSVQLYPARQTA